MPTVVLQGSDWRQYYDDSSSFKGDTVAVGGDGSGRGIRSYIEFDLSSIQNGSTINSATLAMTIDTNNIGYSTRVYRTSSTWAYGASIDQLLGTFDSNSNISCNATSALEDWIENGETNYGFALRYSTEGVVDEFSTYHSPTSPTGIYRPTLTVNYTEPPTPPFKVNVNGTWKDAIKTSIKVSGTWQDVIDAKVKVSGVWKDTL